MLATRVVATIVVTAVTCSCSTHLTHEKGTSAAADAGPDEPFYEYFLPKQTYKIEVTYRLKACPKNVRDANDKLQIRQEAVVTEESGIDTSEHYYITYRDLDSPLKTSSFQVAVYPNQTLKSVGASVEDQTAQTFKNLITSGLTLAKIAMGLPANATSEGPPIPLCNDTTLKALADVKLLSKSLREDDLTPKVREARAARLEALRQYLSVKVQAELEPVRGKPETLTTTLELPKGQKDTWFVEDYFDVLTGMKAEELDRAFKSEAKLEVAEIAHGDSPVLAKKPGRGLVYRSPVPSIVMVCNASCATKGHEVVGGAPTTVAQLGAYRVVLLDNYPFSKNNLTLAFAANGMLESMAYGSEASLPKATGLLAETSALGLGFSTALDAAQEKERAQKETAELSGIQSETALLKAKADLIEARKRLLALEGEADEDSVE